MNRQPNRRSPRRSPPPRLEVLEDRTVLSTFLNADQKFVQGLYSNFLNRSAVQTELNYWTGVLSTAGPIQVVSSILGSPEAKSQLVNSQYLAILNRPAGSDGTAYWVNFLQGGHSEEQLLASLFASGEFANRANALVGGSSADANYIHALYRLALGRNGSDAEVAAWLPQLATVGRMGVADDVLSSYEFRLDAVATLYGDPLVGGLPNLLQRSAAPGAAEVSYWATAPYDLLTLQTNIAVSAEYRAVSQNSDRTVLTLQVNGVTGEGPAGAILVDSFSAALAKASAGAMPSMTFQVAMKASTASSMLFRDAVQGTTINQVVLSGTKAGAAQPYLTWTLANVHITSYQPGLASSDGQTPEDQLTLALTRASVQYNYVNPDGTLGPAIQATYDFQQSRVTTAPAAPVAPADAPTVAPALSLAWGSIVGESYQGQIAVGGFSWGVTNPVNAGTGQPGLAAAQNLTFTANVSQVTPWFFSNIGSSPAGLTAQLTVRTATGLAYLKYTFNNVAVLSLVESAGAANGGTPTDQISLSYSKVTIESHAINPDGTLGPAVTTSYDFTTGTVG